MRRFHLLVTLGLLAFGACSAADPLLGPGDDPAARAALQDGGDTSSNNGNGGGKP